MEGATLVLENNGESPVQFGHDVYAALALGAKRGVNMAIVGGPGMGKSMVFESMDEVFNVCGKPQRDSSFALQGTLDADVLLWQEFTYNRKVCAWEDLLSLLVGERLGIRCCGAKPVQVRNTAPMFVTAAQFLSYRTDNVQEMLAFNLAMQERFNIRVWQIPLPMESRRPDFPRCGCCFSRFVLENEQEYQFQSAVLEGEL